MRACTGQIACMQTSPISFASRGKEDRRRLLAGTGQRFSEFSLHLMIRNASESKKLDCTEH